MEVVCTLADILKQRGMSRRQVARQAGIAPNQVGNLARAYSTVSLMTLSRVCEVLNIEVGDVLKLQPK